MVFNLHFFIPIPILKFNMKALFFEVGIHYQAGIINLYEQRIQTRVIERSQITHLHLNHLFTQLVQSTSLG